MHSLMETWHPCMAVCLCPSHLFLSHTFLECVHGSVHEYMSTLHPHGLVTPYG